MKTNKPTIKTYTFQYNVCLAGKNFPATCIVIYSQHRVINIELKFDLITLAQLMAIFRLDNLDLAAFVESTKQMASDIVFPEVEKITDPEPQTSHIFEGIGLMSHSEYRAWQLLCGVDTRAIANGYGIAIRDCISHPTAKKVKQLFKELQQNGRANPDMMQKIIGTEAMAAIFSLPTYQ